MSQHDYVINNDSGASVRADINSALQAILSSNSGTSAPTSTSAGTLWLDTTGGAPYTLKIRDAGNNHWLTIGSVTDPGADGNLVATAIEGTNVLSTGESGGTKFLREDGDGSCSFQNPANDYEFISKATASNSSSIEFTSINTLTQYRDLVFYVHNCVPSGNDGQFAVQIATSGTSYVTASSKYRNSHGRGYWNGSNANGDFASYHNSSYFFGEPGNLGNAQTNGDFNAVDGGFSSVMTFFQPMHSVHYHYGVHTSVFGSEDGYIIMYNGGGQYIVDDSPFTAIKFFIVGQNIASGSIAMYGVRDA